MAEHGSQEKALIDLGISRTRELGVAIAYKASKKKFFYDNAAYREYLTLVRRGAHVEQATFKLIEGDFFQSEPSDIGGIEAGTDRKRAFLREYPASAGAPEVHLMLSCGLSRFVSPLRRCRRQSQTRPVPRCGAGADARADEALSENRAGRNRAAHAAAVRRRVAPSREGLCRTRLVSPVGRWQKRPRAEVNAEHL